MIFPIKIRRRQTSVSVKTQIAALWYILNYPDPQFDRDYQAVRKAVQTFAIKQARYMLDNGIQYNGKGFSEKITNAMVRSILEKADAMRYKRVFNIIMDNETS